MTDYEYIINHMKKSHFSGWNDEELRKCVDILRGSTRDQQVSLYRSKWIEHEKSLQPNGGIKSFLLLLLVL